MVWELSPVDSSGGSGSSAEIFMLNTTQRSEILRILVEHGAPTFYLFSKGAYKVGRKDCDIILQTDRTISRVHAEVIIDWDPVPRKLNGHSKVILKDHSKFGTFLNKGIETKPIFSLPNKEAPLKDGDLVSFGIGHTAFRFCLIPFSVYIHQTDTSKPTQSVQDLVMFIGGSVLYKWSFECTHMVVEELSPITEEVIEAIVAHKPVILSDYIQAIAEKKVSTEIPSFSCYLPTLTFEKTEFSTRIKIVEPDCRENCLSGKEFVMGSPHMYKFGKKLKFLLEGSGAKVLSVETFNSSNTVAVDGKNKVVVIPVGSLDVFDKCRPISSLPRTVDVNLIAAVLTGHLDETFLESSPVVVSSSHSTDETIVEDSDPEVETVTSHGNGMSQTGVPKCENKMTASGDVTPQSGTVQQFVGSRTIERSGTGFGTEIPEYHNSDIIYSQDLIVTKDGPRPDSLSNKKVVNFKCFRKRECVSGNSFKDLIPFAKDPYIESQGQSEREQFIREERKRKQAEAIAEDLFNAERVKRQKGIFGSSLRGILGHR